MQLTYSVWRMNDAMPDALFGYQKFDIQGFLKDRECFLAYHTLQDKPYSTWLDEKCQAVDLNPKHILVNLQKEKSLISAKTQPADNIMDRALGYGMTDGGDIKSLYGFQTQNEGAIKDLIGDYAKYKKKSVQPAKTVDSGLIIVKPLTAFTSLLYEYTPWTGTPDSFFYAQMKGIHGVYLFWTLWRQYFPQDLEAYNHITEIPKSRGLLDGWLNGK